MYDTGFFQSILQRGLHLSSSFYTIIRLDDFSEITTTFDPIRNRYEAKDTLLIKVTQLLGRRIRLPSNIPPIINNYYEELDE